MTFPRVRAPGLWVLGSVLAPAEVEELDEHQSEAIDGTGGGAYAPTVRITLGGAGWDFTGGTGNDPLGPLTSTAALGTNASGIVATGDGFAAGGIFNGGGTTGNGATGLTVNGNALLGYASGTGMGLNVAADNPSIAAAQINSNNGSPALILGSTSGNALEAFGGGGGAGVVAVGGSTGIGGIFTGGGANGDGLHGIGVGSGIGVYGSSAGASAGVQGIATGGGYGGSFVATAGNGGGVFGQGFGTGPGGFFEAATSAGVGVDVGFGSLRIQSNTASPAAAIRANEQWSGQIVKSVGVAVTDGLGGITNLEGVNFTATINGAATPPGSQIDVAFTTHMASSGYYAGVEVDLFVDAGFVVCVFNKSPAGFSFQAVGVIFPLDYVSTGTFTRIANFSSQAYTVNIAVVGRM